MQSSVSRTGNVVIVTIKPGKGGQAHLDAELHKLGVGNLYQPEAPKESTNPHAEATAKAEKRKFACGGIGYCGYKDI